ncbi:hypothetical protein C8A00DRAFT_18601 [Chaetomidium leptoderma]|uniref:Uncharacterized protein n=1 Tax=Chaetomidium leptoderma TaxID=669021 RepID=A0AAN6VGJ1_9PEZI|nr:hypothetical protein C8A00DRAFT_18601 [Chaetomidium leptoderma]
MCRVKEGRVTKPSVAATPSGSGGAPPRRRRGRPAIEWTRSRKRRLLRLYLCTPEAELSLKKILELLAEGPFQPKPRHTQCLLNDMLSKSYRQKRPKNRTTMGERLAYLRSVRDGIGMFRMDPPPQLLAAAPRREEEVVVVKKECAILLKSNPGAACNKANLSAAQARDTSGEPEEDLDSLLGSPPDIQKPDTASNPSHRSPLDTGGESRTSLESGATDVGEVLGGEVFRNPWSADEDIRVERVDFLRERCPSRSSSFLADVASLLSGLSIRSSLSRSSSGSSRRSMRSVSSLVEASGSGDREAERPSTGLSMTDSIAWSGEMDMPDFLVGSTAWGVTQGSSSHTQENQELVRFCCGKTSWCIHQRIKAVLMHGSPAETFDCTAAEADSRDGLGNTALHVAARWGAPGPVLLRIITLSSHPGIANNRGETFLHVLDPTSLTPRELADLTKHLTNKGVGGLVDFTLLDETNHTFTDRLMTCPSFSLAALEAVFCHLSEPVRLTLLVHHPGGGGGGGGGQLINEIRARVLADPSYTEDAAAEYCAYFVARYGSTGAGCCGV